MVKRVRGVRREGKEGKGEEYVFLGVVSTTKHSSFSNRDTHSCSRVVEEVPAHGAVVVAPGGIAEGSIWVEGSAAECVGLGVGWVVVGRVVAVGGRRWGWRRVHDRDLDGLLGHWVVERGCFCGVHGALHGGGLGVGLGLGLGLGFGIG